MPFLLPDARQAIYQQELHTRKAHIVAMAVLMGLLEQE
jgi:hypothetical protein